MRRKRTLKISPREKNVVFDIQRREPSAWPGRLETVHLGRHFYHRHPWTTSIVALGLVLASVLAADTFLGHANTVYWYPKSCLGGWSYVENAAGAPELPPEAALDEFTADNSAVLNDAISQIFCGQFEGDIPEAAVPISVTLDLSLALKTAEESVLTEQPEVPISTGGEPPIASTTIIIDISSSSADESPAEPAASSVPDGTDAPTEPAPNDTSVPTEPEATPEPAPAEPATVEPEPAPAPEPAPEPVPEPQPEPEPEPPPAETELSPGAWLFRMIHLAFAQEAPAEPEPAPAEPEPTLEQPAPEESQPEPETAPTEEPSQTTEPIEEPPIETPPDAAPAPTSSEPEITPEESGVSTTTTADIEPEATSSAPVIPVGEDILEVRYSVDGETWQTLGTVNEFEWRNVKFTIPLASWEDLQKMQISLVSLPVAEVAPVVYLDGMSLAIDYEPQQPPAGFDFEVRNVSVIVDEFGEAKIDSSTIEVDIPEEATGLQFFAVPDECFGNLDFIKSKIITKPYCGDPIGFPVFPREDTFWTIDRPMRIAIGACRSAQLECDDKPENFILGFVSEEILSPDMPPGTYTLSILGGQPQASAPTSTPPLAGASTTAPTSTDDQVPAQ